MPRQRSIVNIDWRDHLACRDGPFGLIQVIAGSTFGRALKVEKHLQRDLRSRLTQPECPYCGEPLARPVATWVHETTATKVNIDVCSVCGFWRREFDDSLHGRQWAIPYTRAFQPEAHVPALRELAAQVRAAPDRLYTLSAKSFELFVGTVLGDLMDCEVKHVGGTNDGGVDLLVLDADPPLLVQVKRRTHFGSSEGVEVVKTMFASLYAAGQRRGMVVTTANRFTRGAKDWARAPALVKDSFMLELVDMQRLIDMTRRPFQDVEPAWEAYQSLLRKAYVPSTDGFTYREVGEQAVVDTNDGSYIFVRADRDCCVRLDGTKEDIDRTIRGGQSARAPTARMDGFEFAELLLGWPDSVVDALVDFWSGPQGELFVGYDSD